MTGIHFIFNSKNHFNSDNEQSHKWYGCYMYLYTGLVLFEQANCINWIILRYFMQYYYL
jgi:hypothetical protein